MACSLLELYTVTHLIKSDKMGIVTANVGSTVIALEIFELQMSELHILINILSAR